MAIEIRELIITATVDDSKSEGGDTTAPPTPASQARDKESIIQECVDQVMHILRQEKRR